MDRSRPTNSHALSANGIVGFKTPRHFYLRWGAAEKAIRQDPETLGPAAVRLRRS